jgi:predicted Zn-dependent peptidase
VVAQALAHRVEDSLREDFGASYGIVAGVEQKPYAPDFEFVFLALRFEPGKAVALTQRAVRLAEQLGRDGLTPDDFARALAPQRTAAREELRRNAAWARAALCWAQAQPGALERARDRLPLLESLTREEVNAVARQVLRRGADHRVIVLPKSAGADAPAK